MVNRLIQEFFNRLPTLDEPNLWLFKTAYFAAPVLAGNKPAVALNFPSKFWEESGKNLLKSLPFRSELHFFEIRQWNTNTSVILYNREQLTEVIFNQNNLSFLLSQGYQNRLSLLGFLDFLKTRSENDCPHEIGIFLGIPVEDVTGFIINRGQGYLLKKYWKVYHFPERAQTIFNSYDRAKLAVVKQLLK